MKRSTIALSAVVLLFLSVLSVTLVSCLPVKKDTVIRNKDVTVSNWGSDYLCPECKEMGHITNIGKCKNCGRGTSSGAYKLCNSCAAKLNKCQCCKKDLK